MLSFFSFIFLKLIRNVRKRFIYEFYGLLLHLIQNFYVLISIAEAAVIGHWPGVTCLRISTSPHSLLFQRPRELCDFIMMWFLPSLPSVTGNSNVWGTRLIYRSLRAQLFSPSQDYASLHLHRWVASLLVYLKLDIMQSWLHAHCWQASELYGTVPMRRTRSHRFRWWVSLLRNLCYS